MKELIKKLRSKPHYVKLLNILVMNGLLDIIEDELKDNHVDYIDLTVNVITFLNKNKKHYVSFSSDKFDKVIILCMDEILTKKFKIDLDSEQLESILNLLKNKYLIRNFFYYIRDNIINIYHRIKCNKCNNPDDVVKSTQIIRGLDSI